MRTDDDIGDVAGGDAEGGRSADAILCGEIDVHVLGALQLEHSEFLREEIVVSLIER